MREFLSDWHNLLPLAGLGVLAIVALALSLRRKPEDAAEVERQRRAYLNRIGRIVEGQVLEIVDHRSRPAPRASAPPPRESGSSGMFRKRAAAGLDAAQKLLYYTYSISGVTYETAQDITGLDERLHLARVAAGQTASVKYDPSNPSNSILLADDWSGLH